MVVRINFIPRVSNIRPILLHRYCSNKATFRDAVKSFRDVKFVPIRIRGFLLGDSFSRASIDFTEHFVDKNGNAVDYVASRHSVKKGDVFKRTIRFSSIFAGGLEELKLFSSGQELKDDQLNFVIHSFIYGFWNKKDYHEKCLENIHKEEKENKITVLLACHLFSKMTNAMGRHYLVDKHISKFEVCPCKANCGEKIEYGSAGIGSEYLWYGYPDILLFPPGGSKVSVVLAKIDEDDEHSLLSIDEKQKQVVEVKINSKDLRNKFNVRQFIAQALTFSIYQKVYQLDHPHFASARVSVIPTIAVSAESFDIYLYDIENDILLRNDGDPIPLWKKENGKNKLDLSSVLMLWMVVNHLSFKPSVNKAGIEKMKGSCNFLPHFSTNELKTIESSVHMKSYFKPLKEESMGAIDMPVEGSKISDKHSLMNGSFEVQNNFCREVKSSDVNSCNANEAKSDGEYKSLDVDSGHNDVEHIDRT